LKKRVNDEFLHYVETTIISFGGFEIKSND